MGPTRQLFRNDTSTESKHQSTARSPFGKGGALGMSVGWVPGANVVARGLVGADEALTTIEAKGTAVGFVDKRVKVRDGVDVGAVMFVAEGPGEVAAGEVAGEVGGEVVAWRGL
jgi:hypothetical protein